MLTIKETTKETKAQPKTSYEIAAQAAYDKKSWDISILNMEAALDVCRLLRYLQCPQ